MLDGSLNGVWLGSLDIVSLGSRDGISLGLFDEVSLGYLDGSYVAVMIIYTLVIAAGFAALVYGQFKIGQTRTFLTVHNVTRANYDDSKM